MENNLNKKGFLYCIIEAALKEVNFLQAGEIGRYA